MTEANTDNRPFRWFKARFKTTDYKLKTLFVMDAIL